MAVVLDAPQLLTREEAAEYLNIRPNTLAVWFCTGRYTIPVVKIGRSVRYRRADLDKWLTSRTVNADEQDDQ